jgi:hypothetical protein
MHNRATYRASDTLFREGLAVLRFNFRGVGSPHCVLQLRYVIVEEMTGAGDEPKCLGLSPGGEDTEELLERTQLVVGPLDDALGLFARSQE